MSTSRLESKEIGATPEHREAPEQTALVLLPEDIPTLAYRGQTFILLGRRVEARRDLEAVIAKAKPTADDAPFIQRAKGLMPYAAPAPAAR